MLERKLPRCLWPRSGICGREYGLGDRWYLRIEDRIDPNKHRMMRYTEAFKTHDRDNCDKSQEKLEVDRNSLYKKDLSDPSLSRGTSRTNSQSGWDILRRNTFHQLHGEINHAMEEEVYNV